METRVLFVPLLTVFIISPLAAQNITTTLDFDSVNTSVAPYSVDATSYLASKGITLSGVTTGTRVVIVNDLGYYGGQAVKAPSPPKTLTQTGSNAPVEHSGVTESFRPPCQCLRWLVEPRRIELPTS